ncbi:MAG: protein-methionine-sulfoxide reductase catalytic subunit MsrP [Methylococcales bacterium]|nr:protein-methionine-sulfoxide reductase catalytic subunit MsrP [Methylococcales bacterium]
MLIKTAKPLPASEITDPLFFYNRRRMLKGMLATAALASGVAPVAALAAEPRWQGLPAGALSDKTLTPTPAALVKNYTNYYEFTLNKEDATQLAQALPTDPWSLEIAGEVEKPGVYPLEDLLKRQTMEERIYRFRCVEGWAMVVPWVGFPLGNLLKTVQPLSTARFVSFTTILRPEVMPGQRTKSLLDWPYVEALRIDEAMHPLTILAVGMYGDVLPKQNGAPLRLVVPWKYGFKSIKAIIKIELLRNAPVTTWNLSAPNEYGFYANVNPTVQHPRWSQSSERLLGDKLFTPRRATEMYNGYGEQVAALYSGMDLRRFY